MNKTLTVLFVLILMISGAAVVNPISGSQVTGDSWEKKSPMHQARGGLGVVAVNDTIFAIGGTTASGLYPPDIYGGFVGTNEEYNITSNTWTYRSPMPTPRDYFAIVAYENKIYCIGGHISNHQDENSGFYSYVTSGINEVYDVTTDTWVTKASMPTGGMNLQASIMDNKLLVTGQGLNYLYDPMTDTWSNSSALPPTSLQGRNPSYISIIYEGKTMPTDVIHGATSRTTGIAAPKLVYVMGLLTGFPPPKVNEVYDPQTDSWTRATTMPTLRWDFGLAIVNDVIYAIGGFVQTSSNNFLVPTDINEQYLPIGYGTPDPSYVLENTPNIFIQSPVYQTYNGSSVSLVFTYDKIVNWIGYSLDGRENITIAGNMTLTELSNGPHNLTVYVKDALEHTSSSQTVSFAMLLPQPSTMGTIVILSGAIAVTIAALAGLLLHFKKKRERYMIPKN